MAQKIWVYPKDEQVDMHLIDCMLGSSNLNEERMPWVTVMSGKISLLTGRDTWELGGVNIQQVWIISNDRLDTNAPTLGDIMSGDPSIILYTDPRIITYDLDLIQMGV